MCSIDVMTNFILQQVSKKERNPASEERTVDKYREWVENCWFCKRILVKS